MPASNYFMLAGMKPTNTKTNTNNTKAAAGATT